MPNPTEAEVLGFARWQRAVNHLAVATVEHHQALLTGTDRAVEEAENKLRQAEATVHVATWRAVAERVEALHGGRVVQAPTNGALEPDVDDDFDQSVWHDPEPVADDKPLIEHRVLEGSKSDTALCGASMADSTPGPIGTRCAACDAELTKRLGLTTQSPTFGGPGITSGSFRV